MVETIKNEVVYHCFTHSGLTRKLTNPLVNPDVLMFFPQQRKLMGSSAQNSSGVHWCRRQVRFNEVPEKVPKVPEKVWVAFVQSQVKFNRVPEKVPGSLGAKRSQVQQGSGSGEGLGGFGAEPGQVQQGSGEGSGDGLGGFGAEPGQVDLRLPCFLILSPFSAPTSLSSTHQQIQLREIRQVHSCPLPECKHLFSHVTLLVFKRRLVM